MKVQLRPEIQKFVDARVEAGEYVSTTEVVEAGIARLMRDSAPELDQKRAAAIHKGKAAGEFREESRPWDQLLGKYF